MTCSHNGRRKTQKVTLVFNWSPSGHPSSLICNLHAWYTAHRYSRMRGPWQMHMSLCALRQQGRQASPAQQVLVSQPPVCEPDHSQQNQSVLPGFSWKLTHFLPCFLGSTMKKRFQNVCSQNPPTLSVCIDWIKSLKIQWDSHLVYGRYKVNLHPHDCILYLGNRNACLWEFPEMITVGGWGG